ncbi:RING finger protein 112-like [Phyllobates terribilis]|uniref:RING finger protein 112-like n=1 Tax=Phyllobates terribilis TaxID=111132 RepID=UPI003CCB2975
MAESSEGSVHFSKLKDDIICSICLHDLSDPVSTTYGHTYCKTCISSYWSSTQPADYCCPECRKVCPSGKLTPAYRLNKMVSNVQLAVEEQSKVTPPCAKQLVFLDPNGKMCLDESVLDRCFLDSKISGYPLCLICVIGEKRRGKSTLLNYILRALHSLENGQPISLGDQDEPLKGFEWKSGIESLTKGIWMWNRPFILERNGDKMAVFILDTEGSLDIESDRETCVKISALSMLLSSYLIFNVSASLKTTELDYLEMYLHVSEVTGDFFGLQYLQHLNILIRDWQSSNEFGQKAANSYKEHEMEKLRKRNSNCPVLKTLSSPSTSSFLLPHPGIKFPTSGHGRLSDMNDDFRSHLTTYITNLLGGVWLHCKTNVHGERITCGQLGRILKDFVRTLQQKNFSFNSPMELFYALENYKSMNKIKEEFEEFIENKVPSTFSPVKILKVKPDEMREVVSEEAARLRQVYESSLKGGNDAKKKLMEELKNILDQTVEKVCTEYSKRYKKYVMVTTCAVSVGVLTLTGGIAGPFVAGPVLATELAIMAGGSIGGAIGTAVGCVGAILQHIGINQRVRTPDDQGNNNESTPEDTQQLLANAE